MLGHTDRALEHLGTEETSHQLLVGTVAQQLRLQADRAGVLGSVGGSLPGQPALQDLLRRPPVDGVGRDLDLEHPVRNVLADTRPRQAGLAGGTLEGLELAPPLIDRHDAGLGLELGLDVGVVVLAGDLAYPAARVVTHDEDDELRVMAAGAGEDGELRAGLGGDERAQGARNPRPPAPDGTRHLLPPQPERNAGLRRDLDRRPGKDAGRIEEQRHAPLLSGMQPDR